MGKNQNRGIVTTYAINKEYFTVGSAYQMRLGTNDYRVAVLTNCSDSTLDFQVFDKKGQMEDLAFTVDDILFHDYEIIKMEPDYTNGAMARIINFLR